jgi:uncharacterized protein (TIGR03435 family)
VVFQSFNDGAVARYPVPCQPFPGNLRTQQHETVSVRKLGNVNMNGGAAGSTMVGKGMTMSRLADILSGVAKRPVMDATGLPGAYDLELKYSTEMAAPDAGASPSNYPSLFTALKEQLGLHLNSRKGKAAVWVVVRAERPTGN